MDIQYLSIRQGYAEGFGANRIPNCSNRGGGCHHSIRWIGTACQIRVLIGPKKYQKDAHEKDDNPQSDRQHDVPSGPYCLSPRMVMNPQWRFHVQARRDLVHDTFPLRVKPEGKSLCIHRTCRDLTPDRVQRSETDNPGYKRSGRNTRSRMSGNFFFNQIFSGVEKTYGEIRALFQQNASGNKVSRSSAQFMNLTEKVIAGCLFCKVPYFRSSIRRA